MLREVELRTLSVGSIVVLARLLMINVVHIICAIYFFLVFTIPGNAAERLVNAECQRGSAVLSFNDIFSRASWQFERLSWTRHNQLVGNLRRPGENGVTSRFIYGVRPPMSTVGAVGELFSFSLSSKSIVREHDASYALVDETGGRTVINLPTSHAESSTPILSPDGRYIAYSRVIPPDVQRTRPLERFPGVNAVETIAESDSWLRFSSEIILLSTDSPSELRRVRVNGAVTKLQFGRSGSLYFTKVGHAERPPSTYVYRIDPGSAIATEIYSTRGRVQGMAPSISPDENWLAVMVDLERRQWDDLGSLVLVNARTGAEVRRVTPPGRYLRENAIWGPGGETLYFTLRDGGFNQIYRASTTGNLTLLTAGPRNHFGISISPDGETLAYQTQDGYGRRDVRLFSLTEGTERTGAVIDDPGSELCLGRFERIRWQSTDDIMPFGYLIYPPNFNPQHEYPLIVDIHGGGQGSDLYLFGPLSISVAHNSLEWHAWAALGYIVFVPDYRSTGNYGADAIERRIAHGLSEVAADAQDVRLGIEAVVERGNVRADRIGLIGHSAGGARGLYLLARSNIFRAAVINEPVPPDGVSSIYEFTTGDFIGGIPVGIEESLGSIESHPERYAENSLFDLAQSNTPILLMRGGVASRGAYPHMHTDFAFSLLRSRNVPTRLITFNDDGHVYSARSARAAVSVAQEWFDLHLNRSEVR